MCITICIIANCYGLVRRYTKYNKNSNNNVHAIRLNLHNNNSNNNSLIINISKRMTCRRCDFVESPNNQNSTQERWSGSTFTLLKSINTRTICLATLIARHLVENQPRYVTIAVYVWQNSITWRHTTHLYIYIYIYRCYIIAHNEVVHIYNDDVTYNSLEWRVQWVTYFISHGTWSY